MPLPAVVDAEKATQPGAPQLHENAPNNVVFEWPVGDKDGTDAAFANAEVVVKQRLVNNRLIPNPMEVRGDIGWYNPGTDEYTVWMSSQTPHIQRLLLTAFVTGIPEHKVRCISPDVGGAFGTKIFCYADMALVMFASKLVGGLPVKWVEGRRESYGSTIHGRDHITYVEAAANRNGEVQALRVKTLRQPRRAPVDDRPGHPDHALRPRPRGPVQDPQRATAEVTGVYTNTTFVDAYRGAGRPEATYVVERAMDLVADELGIDPAEVRRRNFLPPDSFPYDNPSGLLTAVNGSKLFIDSGNYEPAMDKALGMAGYADMAATKAEAKARGKLLGVGLSTYIEVCGVAPSKWIGAVGEGWGAAMWESSNIKVHLTGKAVVTMGTQPQGQGHETTYAQIISHELGIPMDDIVVQHSDTQGTPFGYGSYGSPDVERRHRRGPQGRGQDPREGAAVRRAHARGQRRGHRDRRRRVPGQGLAREEEDDPGDRVRARPRVRHAGGHGALPRRDGVPRHAELHVPVRDPHRDRRDRRGDGHGRPRPLHRGRRRGQEDQPDDRRRPAPRRHRPGRRPGAVGGRRSTATTASCSRARCSTTRCRGPRGCRASSSTRP